MTKFYRRHLGRQADNADAERIARIFAAGATLHIEPTPNPFSTHRRIKKQARRLGYNWRIAETDREVVVKQL